MVWATELEAGGYAPCPGAGLYSINVELTEKGLEHYREVVKVILSYDFLGEIKEIFESKEKLLGLHLPHHNVSIPSELNVKKEYVDVPARAPKLIRYDDNVRTWWKKDDQFFWVPKANIHIYFRTSVTGTTFRSKLIIYLFVDLLHDALVVHSYDAALAGLEYELNGHSYGFEITIHGYKDKLHVLLETVLDQVRSLVVKEERFDIVRDQMLHNSRDWDFEQPSHQVSIYSDFLEAQEVLSSKIIRRS
jgi:insulysin